MSAHRPTAAIVVAVLLLAACGGDSSGDDPIADPVQDEGASAAATTTDTDELASSTTVASDAGDKPVVSIPDQIPTELVVTDLVVGDGDEAAAGDTVELLYVGVLSKDGTEFDSNWGSDRLLPVVVGSGGVIPGFDQGLVGIRQGGRRQIDIPAALAYGDRGAGDVIGPGEALTFVVEAVTVTKRVLPEVPPMADPSECPATDGSEEQRREFDGVPPFCIDVTKTYTATIATNFGELVIELDPERAPQTVNSFVTLARYGYFDGTVCHRAIPGFVVQCGDPTATGTGGPGYMLPDELPLPGEYQIGSVAMANAGPDTGGSQFFIVTGPNGAALPPSYSLFGQVTQGVEQTLLEIDGVANPENNGVPPLDEIRIESVTITES